MNTFVILLVIAALVLVFFAVFGVMIISVIRSVFKPWNQQKIRNVLSSIVTMALLYWVFIYQDSASFQTGMKFLFHSDDANALPSNWLKNRMLIIGIVTGCLGLYFYPVIHRYRTLVSVHQTPSQWNSKPHIPVRQANYIDQQNPSASFVTWLIEMCHSGAITLHDNPNTGIWQIAKNHGPQKISVKDHLLLDELFTPSPTLLIAPSQTQPVENIRAFAVRLYQEIEKDTQPLIQAKTQSFIFWICLIALLGEIPFLNALYPNLPGLLPISVALIAATGFFVYTVVFCLTRLYSITHPISLLLLTFGALVLTGIHWGLLSGRSVDYMFVFFYPELVIALAIAATSIPKLPQNIDLLRHLIGYRNHLICKKEGITADDLPWTIGLGIQSGLNYRASASPNWLKSQSTDLQQQIDRLHTDFVTAIHTAIHGAPKRSHGSLRHYHSLRRY